MSFHGVFYTNNTYYYCTAKKLVQTQKKRVRFKFPTPLNSSPDLVSYIAPVSPPFQFACQYPAIMCPPPPRISDE